MATARTLQRPGTIRVEIEPANGTQGQAYTYDAAVPAYARFSGAQSIALGNPEGIVNQNAPTLVFLPGYEISQIRSSNGDVVTVPLGSRVTWGGRYYTVIRVTDQYDEFTGRLIGLTLALQDAGKAPVVEEAAVDPRDSDRGVSHDLRDDFRPRDAVRGGTIR